MGHRVGSAWITARNTLAMVLAWGCRKLGQSTVCCLLLSRNLSVELWNTVLLRASGSDPFCIVVGKVRYSLGMRGVTASIHRRGGGVKQLITSLDVV